MSVVAGGIRGITSNSCNYRRRKSGEVQCLLIEVRSEIGS